MSRYSVVTVLTHPWAFHGTNKASWMLSSNTYYRTGGLSPFDIELKPHAITFVVVVFDLLEPYRSIPRQVRKRWWTVGSVSPCLWRGLQVGPWGDVQYCTLSLVRAVTRGAASKDVSKNLVVVITNRRRRGLICSLSSSPPEHHVPNPEGGRTKHSTSSLLPRLSKCEARRFLGRKSDKRNLPGDLEPFSTHERLPTYIFPRGCSLNVLVLG